MGDGNRANYWMQTNPFPDVEITHWFNNGVSTATNANLVTGYPDGTFQPQRAVTRAEFTTLVVRFMGAPIPGAPRFSDIDGHWAQAYINSAAINGWVEGFYGLGGPFLPDQTITRAQAAAIVNRMLGRLPYSPESLLPGMRVWPDNMNTNAWYYLYIQEATNSHFYVRRANGIHEDWTQLLLPERRWYLLERPYSRPYHLFRQ